MASRARPAQAPAQPQRGRAAAGGRALSRDGEPPPLPAPNLAALYGCAIPSCTRAADHGLPLADVVVGLCSAHAINARGAHQRGVHMRLPDGRRLPIPQDPLPLVFGGKQLRAAMRAAAARRDAQRRRAA